ncbi:NAD(P)/FAD-dependent oxidoreductase [Microbacterium horticulturae]|uniref:NAD(P)/FAD-dependent oxidoreductase n=1 Tax=Microbacterium horticulturae TaxID=3028316 RepID=A0ABY8C0N4_9MICO|nr:NAD(P)/FAD-dependent oxidoreductase [Microbacterium sp. KACC 23027]WEG08596.1 NAD(P)/FAD-dependent oxidoreductase [Microbacterium sp. KACC 23027]
MSELQDVLVIGGGPAGLSAALNLGRSVAEVTVVDADRPRNAATLTVHGFLTRDGIAPNELKKIAREELNAYPTVHYRARQRVFRLGRDEGVFVAEIGQRQATDVVFAQNVLLATGLQETLPAVPDLISYYGMSLFSCAACDGWEQRGQRLGLFGAADDLADRARLISHWTDALTVFTHGAALIDAVAEAELVAAGVTVERTPVTALHGEKGHIERVELADGRSIPLDGGFIRPEWSVDLSFLDGIVPDRDENGHLVTDGSGRTSEFGLYAAGDITDGAQQLIVAAGAGARTAAVIVHDAVGVVTSH